MKYIGSLFFIVLLIWTWTAIHKPASISFETHAGIQMRMADLIKSTVMEKKPAAQNIEIMRLWTEPVSDSKVRALFAYKFFEPSEANQSPTESTIEGEALLERQKTENSEQDPWSIVEIKTTGGEVYFTEGLLVNSADTAPPVAPAAPVAPAPSAPAASTPPVQTSPPAHQ